MASEWSAVFSPVLIPAILIALALLLWIVWDVLDKRCATYAAILQFPGPPVWPLIGTMYNTRGLDAAKTFEAFRYWTNLYGGSYRMWFNSRLFGINITQCELAEPFFSGGRNTDKSLLYRFLHPFVGVGLLNSAGSKWLQRRRILTPTFHFNILNGFHRAFCEETEKLAARIDTRGKGTTAVEVDLPAAMSQLTLNTICETSMGVKLDTLDGAVEYREGIYKAGEMLLNRAVRPWLYVDWTYRLFGYMRQFQRLLKPLHIFTSAIITQRRELFAQGKLNDLSTTEEPIDDDQYLYGGSSGAKKRYAMLDTLLAAEMRGLIDADGIREEVDTFTFEGHDTTGSALVFIFLTLSWEPAIQERLYQELHELHTERSTGDGHLSPNDLSSLKFFDRVVKECFRLWPPVAFISRQVTDEIVLPDGRSIPRGAIANLHIFDLHRDPQQFPDPDRFDPDRFLPEVAEKRNPYAYVPFSAGQRNCIGQKYALLEIKTVVAYLVLRYRVLPVTKRTEIRFIADLVLRASTPLKVRFEKRSVSEPHRSTTGSCTRSVLSY
uniref:Cytochrome P450 n=1 Tax=Anopheles dirus TaxID=7168 RepID=A0A2Y9D1P1_9DIPT